MSEPQPEIEAFRDRLRDWLEAHRPEAPAFRLPQSMLAISSDEQFRYLVDWQRRVYEAGYVGVEWPEAYGGRGLPQGFQLGGALATKLVRVVDQDDGVVDDDPSQQDRPGCWSCSRT